MPMRSNGWTKHPIFGGERLFLLSAICILAGCAIGTGTQGQRLLKQGSCASAAEQLKSEVYAQPENANLICDLGAALLCAGDPDAAVEWLQQAKALDPEDHRVHYFLARAADESGQVEAALEGYGNYLAYGGKGERFARSRIRALSLKQISMEIQSQIAGRERKLSAELIPEKTVAVPPFSNIAASDTLAPLSYGLASVMITDLKKIDVEQLRVVERERIQVLLQELERMAPTAVGVTPGDWGSIATTEGIQRRLKFLQDRESARPYYDGPVDGTRSEQLKDAIRRFQEDHRLVADGVSGPKTQEALDAAIAKAVEGGQPTRAAGPTTSEQAQILGARRFLQGSFLPIGVSDIQLDMAVQDALQGGAPLPVGAPVSGPLGNVLRLEKALVYQTLRALGIEPTQEQRRQIDELPTESFPAFLAYSRGLFLEHQGRAAEAQQAYEEALQYDPKYREARMERDFGSVTAGDAREQDLAEIGGPSIDGADVEGRLERTVEQVGIGPAPDSDEDDDQDVTQTAEKVVSETGTIVIEGTIPPDGRP